MNAKSVCESGMIMPVRMMPQDANPAGFVHAGVVLRNIDLIGAIVAMRHARTSVVTVSIDRMDFLATGRVGEVMYFKGYINYVGNTSMEVGVRVETEDLQTSHLCHAASAYLTFVAVDAERKPTPVPPLRLETPDEHRRFGEARQRRDMRKNERRSEREGQHRSREDELALAGGDLGGGGLRDVVMPVRMMPQDANPAGNVHGGVILRHIDMAGSIAAMRHCQGTVVTSAIERMEFLSTGKVGEVMSFKASVNMAVDHSMEVGVRVESENLFTGEIRHAASAYLSFHALDDARQPMPAPPIYPKTLLEQRRFDEAHRRRELRHLERQRERAAQARS